MKIQSSLRGTKKGYCFPTIRKELLTFRGNRCERCYNTKPISFLDIDHTIPMSLGGQTEKSNLKILCKNCHHEKNRINIKILSSMVHLGFIERKLPYQMKRTNKDYKYNLSNEDVVALYYNLFEKMEKMNKKQSI